MNDRARWGLFDLLKTLDTFHAGELHGEFVRIAQGLGLELPVVAPPLDSTPGYEAEAAGEVAGEADGEVAATEAWAEDLQEKDPSGAMLLEDIRSVFAAKGVDRISSEDLCKALAGMPERPWPRKSQGRPITTQQLAWLLRQFKIRPTTVWLPEKPLKGYHLQAFASPGLAPSFSVRS